MRKLILPAAWAKAERLYFEGETGLADIGEKCGINRTTLYRHARKHNWPDHATLRVHASDSERAALRRIIIKKLAAMEKRMNDPQAETGAVDDTGRDARAVASLLGSINKLDVTEKTWREEIFTTPTDDPLAAYGDDNVADWRAEIARRLESLGAKSQQ